jgi:hypothetical protein
LEGEGQLWKVGFINFGAMLFLLLAILALSYYLDDQTVKFDEDEQTAQDYSILINNPPSKATDPEQWRRYFEKNWPGLKCAAITCAVNNDLLVKALVKRREVLRMMELQLDPGTPMDIDNLALLAAKEARSRRGFLGNWMAVVVPGIPELVSELVSLNTSVKGLAQLSYPCTNVFVTFETEKDQRDVLSKLSVGHRHLRSNNGKALSDPKYLFEGHLLLKVEESVEPNSVRWQDLNVTLPERMDQMIMANIVTFGCIYGVSRIVSYSVDLPAVGAALSISGKALLFGVSKENF